jgi:hypothetical protein
MLDAPKRGRGRPPKRTAAENQLRKAEHNLERYHRLKSKPTAEKDPNGSPLIFLTKSLSNFQFGDDDFTSASGDGGSGHTVNGSGGGHIDVIENSYA